MVTKTNIDNSKFDPITQYIIKNWYQKQIKYTHNSRTLENTQGVSGEKHQHLITIPQLFQYFPQESRDLFFKGTQGPAENFGQYSH